jgi:hypothetical protein
MMHGKIGKHLAIDRNGLLVQAGDELRIRRSIRSRCRIDTGHPETAELPLLCAAVLVRMRESLVDVMLRNAVDLTSGTPISFGTLKQFLPAPVRCDFIL